MKAALVLRLQAIYFGVIGALAALVPQASGGQLGSGFTSFDTFAARSLGVAILTVAALDWIAATALVVRAALWANLFMNVTLAAAAHGTIGASSWLGTTFHAAFIVGLLTALLRRRAVAERV